MWCRGKKSLVSIVKMKERFILLLSGPFICFQQTLDSSSDHLSLQKESSEGDSDGDARRKKSSKRRRSRSSSRPKKSRKGRREPDHEEGEISDR
jgi:hypothetical protein